MSCRVIISIARISLCAALIGGCASARYNTELSAPDGLGPGDPVTNLGAKIGSVAGVNPLPGGNSAVAFDIDYGDQRLVLQDSIMILRKDTVTPSLELLNTNPISVRAPAGAVIEGASNEAEANLLMASHGLPGFNAGIAAMMGALASAPNMPPPPAAAATQGLNVLQQQMAAWQAWYAAASAQNMVVAQQQVRQMSQSVDALERQLIRAGKTPEAQRLRQDFENFARSVTAPGASGPPRTLTIPPVR